MVWSQTADKPLTQQMAQFTDTYRHYLASVNKTVNEWNFEKKQT